MTDTNHLTVNLASWGHNMGFDIPISPAMVEAVEKAAEKANQTFIDVARNIAAAYTALADELEANPTALEQELESAKNGGLLDAAGNGWHKTHEPFNQAAGRRANALATLKQLKPAEAVTEAPEASEDPQTALSKIEEIGRLVALEIGAPPVMSEDPNKFPGEVTEEVTP